MMNSLSIIVPVFNKEQYIKGCIESVLAQTFTDFELILVNDGSTDNSLARCLEYEKKDKRVTVIDQRNQGVSAARNRGLERATGNYIGFVDSDDLISLDMYEILMKNARDTDADISVCGMKVIFPYKSFVAKGSSKRTVYQHRDALPMFLNGGFTYSANNKIVHSRIINKIRFEGRIYEDILAMCKVFLAASVVVFEDFVGYHYIVRDNSTSMSIFGPPYFETIKVSSQMVELVSHENEEAIAAAKAFDIMANVSLLNLILAAGKDNYLPQYKVVSHNLRGYRKFIKSDPKVARKHKYAFLLHDTSPGLYAFIMYFYCLITKSEVISRTKNQ